METPKPRKVREIHGNLLTLKTLGKIFAKHKLIVKDNHLVWKGFYVLQTFQHVIRLSKQQNAEKVAFVVIIS